jgi:hypothetical protein
MVKKTPKGWVVFSEKGKRLSRAYPTEEAANKRLGEIEYFKNKSKSK